MRIGLAPPSLALPLKGGGKTRRNLPPPLRGRAREGGVAPLGKVAPR
jgi:hypothetical protein